MIQRQPHISVVIPVHNGGEYLSRCLDALLASSYESYELIVVDDASTDDSAEIARKKGVAVFQLPHKSGPATARNLGAEMAKGDIVLFIDSDVLVRHDTISRVVSDFMNNPDLAAVFGSYDDSPDATDYLSQYRNLFHHFIHQDSKIEANTFWAGCGAIRRNVFLKLKGFNELQYSKPSIEDIELGMRMRMMGHRILLDKELQVKHLKRWQWLPMIKTDICQRAVPWSQLILESNRLPKDLNLRISHRISSALVGLLSMAIFLLSLESLNLIRTGGSGFFLMICLVLVLVLLALNREFYLFLFRKRGLSFTLFGILIHFLYYLYSGSSFFLCWIFHKLPKILSAFRKLRANSKRL